MGEEVDESDIIVMSEEEAEISVMLNDMSDPCDVGQSTISVESVGLPVVIARQPARKKFGFHWVKYLVLEQYLLYPVSVNIRNPTEANNRVVDKIGIGNVVARKNITIRQSFRYARDFVHTILDCRWRWTLWVFSFSYIGSWGLFGWLWYLVAEANGELDLKTFNSNTTLSCFENANIYAAFFLMALETQMTIGYGNRVPTEHCGAAILLLAIQMIVALGFQGAMLGAVYAKMIRPQKRYLTTLFSKFAVICQRDTKLCLMMRVRDVNHSHIVGTKIQAYLLETHMTAEGEVIQHFCKGLKLEPTGLLLWPLTLVHIIDETSPLFDISARDFLIRRFEIIVALTGSSETTGQPSQIRTSYLSKEILWGHRLAECVFYDSYKEAYIVDHSKFHQTVVVNTPLCSAKRLQQVIDELSRRTHQMIR